VLCIQWNWLNLNSCRRNYSILFLQSIKACIYNTDLNVVSLIYMTKWSYIYIYKIVLKCNVFRKLTCRESLKLITASEQFIQWTCMIKRKRTAMFVKLLLFFKVLFRIRWQSTIILFCSDAKNWSRKARNHRDFCVLHFLIAEKRREHLDNLRSKVLSLKKVQDVLESYCFWLKNSVLA
jgi:hypothetical protein